MSHREKHRVAAVLRRADRVIAGQPADPSNREHRPRRMGYCVNCHTVFKSAPAARIHLFLRACFKVAA